MKQYHSFLIHRQGRGFHYNFLPICTHCGKHADETTNVVLEERLGLSRTTVSIKIPYCAQHIAVIRKFTLIKNGIYLLSFILTVAVLFALGFRPFVLAAIGGAILWAIFVFPLFTYLLIKPLFSLFDKERIFECDTNTLSFTARMEIGSLVLSFLDPAIAQKFALANWNNPLVKHLQGSVISTLLVTTQSKGETKLGKKGVPMKASRKA